MQFKKGALVKAIILGCTGLVGSQLLQFAINHPEITEILTVTRRKQSPLPKTLNLVLPDPIMDGEKNISLTHKIQLIEMLKSFPKDQTIIYCCLGTTIKTAGNRSKFYEVDHDLVIAFAGVFKRLDYSCFWMISAMGADADSSVFYNHVKGETEKDIIDLRFNYCGVVRPSLLLGHRNEVRSGEKLASLLAPLYTPLLIGSLKKYRPIPSALVAQFMLLNSLSNFPKVIANNPVFEVFENDIISEDSL